MSEEQTTQSQNKDVITVSFTKEELSTLATLMAIASDAFKDLAEAALQEKKDTAFAILSARQKLSIIYASRLNDALTIGEPESKSIH